MPQFFHEWIKDLCIHYEERANLFNIKEEHTGKQRIGTQEPHVRLDRTQHQRGARTWKRKGFE